MDTEFARDGFAVLGALTVIFAPGTAMLWKEKEWRCFAWAIIVADAVAFLLVALVATRGAAAY